MLVPAYKLCLGDEIIDPESNKRYFIWDCLFIWDGVITIPVIRPQPGKYLRFDLSKERSRKHIECPVDSLIERVNTLADRGIESSDDFLFSVGILVQPEGYVSKKIVA